MTIMRVADTAQPLQKKACSKITPATTESIHSPSSDALLQSPTSRHRQQLGQLDSPQRPERAQGTMPSM